MQKCKHRIISLGITYLSSIIALSNMPACAQPQLIANSQLDQSRIHDTVDRASYASGVAGKPSPGCRFGQSSSVA